MAGNEVNATVVNQNAAADAAYIASFYAWCKKRLIQWSTVAGSSAQLTALGITDTGDQAHILALVADLNILMTCIEGTQQAANATSLISDLANLTGLSN